MRMHCVGWRYGLAALVSVILLVGPVAQWVAFGAPPGPDVDSAPGGQWFLPMGTPQPALPPLVSPYCEVISDFESFGTWKRGDEPYGDFGPSGELVHGGMFSGKLSYQFPTSGNDYVVFLHDAPIEGRPQALKVWVYGDESGHLLNAWVKDAEGEVWAFPFGRIDHKGWRERTALLDVSGPWPTGHLSGPANGVLDYPFRFSALVLDDAPDTFQGYGLIYVDDLCWTDQLPQPVSPRPVEGPATPGRIAFFRTDEGNNTDIFVVNPDGSDLLRLTEDPAEDRDPAWSPDGTRLVFSSARGGGPSDLYVMNADGSGVIRLAHRPDYYDANPSWSPDGNYIVFESTGLADGNPELYVMNSDGSGVVQLTNKPGSDGDPTWSPDGNRIAYYSTRDPLRGPWELWVMNRDGSAKSQLTMGNDYGPSWSPSGTHIAYVHEPLSSGNAELAVMDVSQFMPVVLTNEPANDMHPAWSPDGKRLAFLSYRTGVPAIYLMNVDGSTLIRLTEGRDPAWSSASEPAFPLFGSLTFSDSLDLVSGGPSHSARAFTYGTSRLYAIWDFQGVTPGTVIRYDWYLDGVPLLGGEEVLKVSKGRSRQWVYNADGSPLVSGTYEFAARLSNRIVLSDQCFVLDVGEVPGQVPLPTVGADGCGLTLVDPAHDSEFGPSTGAVVLRWQLGRPLQAGEYYFVNVPFPHEGTIWYDGTWRDASRQIPDGTQGTAWTLHEYLCATGFSDAGSYDWYVEVRQQRGPEPSLSDPVRCRSETWSFRWTGCASTPTPEPKLDVPPN